MNPKIIDYDILSSDDPRDLAAELREELKEGWQPFGPPFSQHHPEDEDCSAITLFYQAIVRYESPVIES